MSNLATMTNKITGVISLGKVELDGLFEVYESLDRFFKGESKQYGWIVHDLDVLPSGEYKTLHIHYVATANKRKRLGTFLNLISECTGVDTLAITISKYSSFESCFQYLCHRNDPDKAQYATRMIHTNLPFEEVRVLFAEEATALDLEKLDEVVRKANTKTEVLQAIGLYYYRLYRGVINDLWNDLHPYKYRDYRVDKNGEVRNA